MFSCYKPVDRNTPVPESQKQLSAKDWAELYTLARTDKKKAFATYSKYYLSTSGQFTGPTRTSWSAISRAIAKPWTKSVARK